MGRGGGLHSHFIDSSSTPIKKKGMKVQARKSRSRRTGEDSTIYNVRSEIVVTIAKSAISSRSRRESGREQKKERERERKRSGRKRAEADQPGQEGKSSRQQKRTTAEAAEKARKGREEQRRE